MALLIKMADQIRQSQINNDIYRINHLIGDQGVIDLQLWIENDRLMGLIITTDEHIYRFQCNENSIVPISQYFNQYTQSFKNEIDHYYQFECCILF